MLLFDFAVFILVVSGLLCLFGLWVFRDKGDD